MSFQDFINHSKEYSYDENISSSRYDRGIDPIHCLKERSYQIKSRIAGALEKTHSSLH